jgi:hypothetical protein
MSAHPFSARIIPFFVISTIIGCYMFVYFSRSRSLAIEEPDSLCFTPRGPEGTLAPLKEALLSQNLYNLSFLDK